MFEDPQPKQCFVCAEFAQNNGKTLCSLLVFTQLFRARNKERSFFRSVYLRVCVLKKKIDHSTA